MEKANVRVPLGIALLLNEIVNKLLYEVVEVNGKQELKNRSLPFRLLYRLNRNTAALAKDAQRFEELKQECVARYGTISEDLSHIEFTEENKKAYTEAMNNILETPVDHSIIPLDIDDIDKVTANMIINPESMRLFIAYMTDDIDYLNDLSNPLIVKAPEPVKVEASINGEPLIKKEELVKEEKETKEDVICMIEEAPEKPALKKTAKKTTTKKSSEASTLEEKKPAKKASTKKVSESTEAKEEPVKKTSKKTSSTKKTVKKVEEA